MFCAFTEKVKARRLSARALAIQRLLAETAPEAIQSLQFRYPQPETEP